MHPEITIPFALECLALGAMGAMFVDISRGRGARGANKDAGGARLDNPPRGKAYVAKIKPEFCEASDDEAKKCIALLSSTSTCPVSGCNFCRTQLGFCNHKLHERPLREYGYREVTKNEERGTPPED